jgi:hypothetical protein
VLAIELVVLRNVIVKSRGGTKIDEEDPIVPVTVVAEHVKEDFQTVQAFLNPTCALDTNITILFPQTHKQSAIFMFTLEEGRVAGMNVIRRLKKEWVIQELKQSDCSFDTPHTVYIYAPNLPSTLLTQKQTH